MTAASVGATTGSPAQATALPVGPGKGVKSKPHALKWTGSATFGAAGSTRPKPPAKGSKPKLPSAAQAKLINRLPPAKARLRPRLDLGSAAAASQFPQATTLPIHGIGAFGGSAFKGLNSYDDAAVAGDELEPPDQALCEGAGYAVEAVNIVMRIYDNAFHFAAATLSLDVFFQKAEQQTQWADDFLSDPQCYYDPGQGHWFLTVADADLTGFTGSAVLIA